MYAYYYFAGKRQRVHASVLFFEDEVYNLAEFRLSIAADLARCHAANAMSEQPHTRKSEALEFYMYYISDLG